MTANYGKSEGGYGLVSFLFPKVIGIGKFEVLGKFAIAEFTDGIRIAQASNPSYRQKTTEVDLGYIIKQFDARVMSFYKDTTLQRGATRISGKRASACSSRSPRQIH